MTTKLILAFLLTGLALPFANAEDISRMSERELKKYIQQTEKQCEEKKQGMLSEARAKKIQECIDNKEFGNDTERCKTYYSDYGATGVNRQGFRYRAGMFDDLPECVEADRAREALGNIR